MLSKPIELPPKVAKTFVKHMRAYYAEPSAIRRDKIAGDAAHLMTSYLPQRDRKLRLPDIYKLFEEMKDSQRGVATSKRDILRSIVLKP